MVRMSACSKPCGSSSCCTPICAIRVPYYEWPYGVPKYYSTGPYPCYPGFGPTQPGPCSKQAPCGVPGPCGPCGGCGAGPCGPCGAGPCAPGPCGPGTAPCCASLL
ncbi:unnamed protein product [Phyllotreta striolata]|uniref:Uncharacterized protein n=1 Tax=Phyllotreta striolata TaxID=444603 RepID=A0A9N9XTX5_PHYSR|nr:unnamed protein product [Phyllotreta striolata]